MCIQTVTTFACGHESEPFLEECGSSCQEPKIETISSEYNCPDCDASTNDDAAEQLMEQTRQEHDDEEERLMQEILAASMRDAPLGDFAEDELAAALEASKESAGVGKLYSDAGDYINAGAFRGVPARPQQGGWNSGAFRGPAPPAEPEEEDEYDDLPDPRRSC